jgi:CRISPR/Cas system-associated protein endoribonuclease Cas2
METETTDTACPLVSLNWTLVAWDIPLDTKAARREAARVKRLAWRSATDGHRWGNRSKGAALVMRGLDYWIQRIGDGPPDGTITFLGVTDKQFELMTTLYGPARGLVNPDTSREQQ